MKYLFRRLSLPLFLVLCLCVELPASSSAQTTGSTNPNSSSTPLTAQRPKGLVSEKELAKLDPALEERERYHFFLLFFHHHEEGEKALRAEGRTELAEAYRTLLQDKSGLTEAEAIKVKQIAAEYAADVDALNQKGFELSGKYNPHRPPEAKSRALNQEDVDIVNKAITRLVDSLGSRSFSRLDLYTRHYMDAAKGQTDAATKAANAKKAADAAAQGASKP